MTSDDWISFWNSKHSIYVSEQHCAVHYRCIADDILKFVPQGARVLDYGCGEARSAECLLTRASRLMLCDAAPSIRASISRRFATQSRIEVLAPDQVASMSDGAVDLIVMHSVAQYLNISQLNALLALFYRLLSPNGSLVLGDVIGTNASALADVTTLLAFAIREKFLIAAMSGLVRTAFSRYRTLRSEVGLLTFEEQEILAVLTATGYDARRASKNIGHNRTRQTFVARPIAKAPPQQDTYIRLIGRWAP